MKIAAITVLSLVVVFLGVQIFGFVVQENQLGGDLAVTEQNLTKAQAQEASLQSESQYLANPANLEKELRARFNYKAPGETMIVIVPPPAASSTASATSTE